MGKSSIPLFWRLFKAYGYNCYAIFDCDTNPEATIKIFNGLIETKSWLIGESEFEVTNTFAYFGKDFETYFRTSVEEYSDLEKEIIDDYQITSKPGQAKAIAQNISEIPEFINKLSQQLSSIELFGQ